MPVARIISSSFEDALKLSEELRPLFDTIEIAAPGRAGDTVADLEVTVESCRVEDALAEIGKIPQDQEVNVFVAPGSIVPAEVETVAPLEPEVLLPELKVEATPEQQVQMLEETPQAFVADAPLPSKSFEFANEEIPQAFVADAALPSESFESANEETPATSASEPSPMVEIAPPRKPWLTSLGETLQQWQAQYAQLSEQRAVERLQKAAARHQQSEEQEKQRRFAREQEAQRRQEAARRAALLRAEQQRAAQEKAEHKRRAFEAERVRAAEMAARQRVEAALQREAQAQQELARQAEAIRRNYADKGDLRLREDQLRVLVPPASNDPAVAANEELQPAVSSSSEDRRMRVAAMCAGVAAVLLMAGWIGYNNRRPASPLPISTVQQSNSVEETVPFGPAKLVPAVGAAPSRPLPPTTAAKPPAGRRQTPAHKAKRHQQLTEVEVDEVAEDVTVRHFRPKAPVQVTRPRKTSSTLQPALADSVRASNKSDVKQISDLH